MSSGWTERTRAKQSVLLGYFQLVFKLVSSIKVIFYGPFIASCHKNHVADACRVSLFHRVLDQRLVDDGEHFLGLGLGGREKPGAETGHREHCFV
jgi:hypothetical protein